MIYEIVATELFEKWIKRLKDNSTKNKLLSRLARVENGNFGDYIVIQAKNRHLI